MQKLLNVILGCFIVTIGVFVLQNSLIITGGTAGLALSFSYIMPASFAVVFFIINIPFYILAYFKMGWKFTASTIFAVTILSVMTQVIQIIPAVSIHPLIGAISGGAIIGFGLSYLFMNGSSLGGANILSLFLQKKFGWNPGKTLFTFDFLVILTGLYSVGLLRGLYSVISIVIISVIISYFKGKIAEKTTSSKAPYQSKAAVSEA